MFASADLHDHLLAVTSDLERPQGLLTHACQTRMDGFRGVTAPWQNMPRLDGVGLTRQLRGHPKLKATPILILSTESTDEMKRAGRAAGATGWRVKPFDPTKPIEVIHKVVR